MSAYVARRVVSAALLLLIISALVFFMFYVLPTGDAAQLRAGKNATPEQVALLNERLGLDQPWYQQFWRYLRALVLHFDFGYSYQDDQPVRDEVFSRLPASASLALGAAVVWLVIGIAVGVLSSVTRGSIGERAAMFLALVAMSAPVYWLGLVATYLFSKDIGKVPIFDTTGSYVPLWDDPVRWASSLLLPWLVLAAAFAAMYARIMRSSMLDVLSRDYVRTARAKGVPEHRVITHHGMRAAITPIVTIFGIDLGLLLGGAILVETVFNIPGVGRMAVDAITRGDLPLVQGTVLVGAAAIIVCNLLVDVLYAVLDPRVRPGRT